jgi:hypothetical protein
MSFAYVGPAAASQPSGAQPATLVSQERRFTPTAMVTYTRNVLQAVRGSATRSGGAPVESAHAEGAHSESVHAEGAHPAEARPSGPAFATSRMTQLTMPSGRVVHVAVNPVPRGRPLGQVFAAMRAAAKEHPTMVPSDLIETNGNEFLGVLPDTTAIQGALKENLLKYDGPAYLETMTLDDSNYVAIVKAAAQQRLAAGNKEPIVLKFVPNTFETTNGAMKRARAMFKDEDGKPLENVVLRAWETRKQGPVLSPARYVGLFVSHSKTMTFFKKGKDGEMVDAESITWDGNMQATSDPINASKNAGGWYQAGMRYRGPAALATFSQLAEGLEHTKGDDYTLPGVIRVTAHHGGASMLALGQPVAARGGASSLMESMIAGVNAAQHDIYEDVSNLNDPRYIAALADASKRGVRVHVITGMGFNERNEKWFGGGDNASGLNKLKALGDPKNIHEYDSATPKGVATNGNGQYSDHDKFSIYDDVAVVRSKPLDLQGRREREYGMATDDPQAVVQLKETWHNRTTTPFAAAR